MKEKIIFMLLLILVLSLLTVGSVSALDSDGDGIDDAIDNCIPENDPFFPCNTILGIPDRRPECIDWRTSPLEQIWIWTGNPDQADTDSDGVGDICDNCPNNYNPSQVNTDADALYNSYADRFVYTTDPWGDACDTCPLTHGHDPDSDGDGECDDNDNCIDVPNPFQENSDSDSWGDACDNCWFVDNENQLDSDSSCPSTPYTSDPMCGDVCQSQDRDGDGVDDAVDNCIPENDPFFPCNTILGIPDRRPECIDWRTSPLEQIWIWTGNPDQADTDSDGVGDICDNCPQYNPDQINTDADTAYNSYADRHVYSVDPYGDVCDLCPLTLGPNTDNDGDLLGDVCDPDDDNDGVNDTFDNCQFTFNPAQTNSDSDSLGDACDNCINKSSLDQTDTDGDGFGNVCDNCDYIPNIDQSNDWDNDGYGDECDCEDGYKGPYEKGADCEFDDRDVIGSVWGFEDGVCWDCPDCIPYVKNGGHSGRIDIVFVPDKDYGGNMTQFVEDVGNIINNGYFGATEFYDNRCKFNFYYYPKQGNYKPICEKWKLPDDFDDDCGFADSTGIIFTGGGRACAKGDGEVFSAPPGSTRTVVHETGHAIFDQADEYCCDGGYFVAPGHQNIFHHLAGCQKNSVNPDGCWNFCPDGTQCNWRGQGLQDCCEDGDDGWWKSDNDTCYMLSGNVFEPDSRTKVINKLNSLSACQNPGEAAAFINAAVASSPSQDNTTKTVILNYNTNNGTITLLSTRFVYNDAPDHFNEHGDYEISEISSQGGELFETVFDDPRAHRFLEHKNYEQGMMMTNDVNFTVRLPFLDTMKIVNITELETNETVHTADISQDILDFCQGMNYNDPQCLVSDLDNDDVTDQFDNCPFTDIPESLPTIKLGVNRFALVDEDNVFDTTDPKGKGPRKSFTTSDTFGCSCEQIIDWLHSNYPDEYGEMKGQYKYGCSISVIEEFIEMNE